MGRPLPPAILLMGPTASGKTDLAIALRDRLPVELISVDELCELLRAQLEHTMATLLVDLCPLDLHMSHDLAQASRRVNRDCG